MKIFKYPLLTGYHQAIKLPRGAEILCVQLQNSAPFIWAKVDETEPLESRAIYTFGTGNEYGKKEYSYIGTYQLNGGDPDGKAIPNIMRLTEPYKL